VGGEHSLKMLSPYLALMVWDRQCLEDFEEKAD
jgi:hypothetical protein